MPLPEKIANAPELFPWLELYWWAYQDLSTCRPAGFGGAYPIPWTSVNDYAIAHGYDQEQTADLTYFVRKMDKEFLQWYEAKQHGNKSNAPPIQAKHAPTGKVGGLGSRT
jgi:hypothetical protein